MIVTQLPVKINQNTNSFVHIPDHLASKIKQNFTGKFQSIIPLQLVWNDPSRHDLENIEPKHQCFVGWKGDIASECNIEIPFKLAENLSILDTVNKFKNMTERETFHVSIKLVTHAAIATSLSVEPLTNLDWMLLQRHANIIEDELLQQICVLSPKQVFSIWIYNKINIQVKVCQINSIEQNDKICVKLARDTEIAIIPKLCSDENEVTSTSIKAYECNPQNIIGLKLRVYPLKTFIKESNCSCDDYQSWNRIGIVHPSVLKQLNLGAKWPNMKIDNKKCVLIATDKETPIFVLLSNAKRERFSHKKNIENIKQSFMSITNRDFIHLHADDLVVPGHIVLPQSSMAFCKVKIFDFVIIKLPEFKPTFMPCYKEPLFITLTPILSQKELSVLNIEDFTSNALNAICEWKSNFLRVCENIPFVNQCFICLNLKFRNEPTYFLVNINENPISSSIKKTNQNIYSNYNNTAKHYNPLSEVTFSEQSSTISVSRQNFWVLESTSNVDFHIDILHIEKSDPKFLGSRKIEVKHQKDGKKNVINNNSTIHDSHTSSLKFKAPNDIHNYGSDYYSVKSLDELIGKEKVAEQIFFRLDPILNIHMARLRLKLGAPHCGGVYLFGDRGCGKTTLCHAIAKKFRDSSSSLAHTVFVSCATLRRKKQKVIEQVFSQAFS